MKTVFVADLVRVNRLDRIGFRRLLFFPGMLFNSNETWWGSGGARSSSHEGLDLCFFESEDMQAFRVDENVQVPAAFSGPVVRIMDDFLGKTIVTSHGRDSGADARVYVFYAHIRPQKDLGLGDSLAAGECFARIAPVPSKAPLPPHLHLTIGRADRLPPLDAMSWPRLNRVDRNYFHDPLPILGWPYRILPGFNNSAHNTFKPCGEMPEA